MITLSTEKSWWICTIPAKRNVGFEHVDNSTALEEGLLRGRWIIHLDFKLPHFLCKSHIGIYDVWLVFVWLLNWRGFGRFFWGVQYSSVVFDCSNILQWCCREFFL